MAVAIGYRGELGDVGAGDRSRTGDLAITNRTLYQLSYAGLSMHLNVAQLV